MKIEDSETKKKELRTSKGYRLKVSTHNLIKSLQELTRNDADTVITESILLMYKKVLAEKESNIITN